jgi:L-asparaginase
LPSAARVSGKSRICLIYTGGTIGMIRDEKNELRPPDDPEDFLRVAPELEEIVSYEFVPLLNKDSTNVIPSDWTKIARAVYDRRDDGYDGFVVVHGTDTMHFSASAVAFALGPGLPVPVVFTGAQTIPEVPHGDARVNLLRACKVASTELAEVAIAFGDFVFRGARAQKKNEAQFDAFESPAFFPLALITEEIILAGEAMTKDEKLASQAPYELRDHFASGVLQVSLIPGLEPSLVMPALEQEACKGLILQSFGAGNVPNARHYSFRQLIRAAVERNKPVIVTSQFPANATLHTAYRPGRDAVRAGAISTGNMTASCAVAKFRWALAMVEREKVEAGARIDRVREIMNRTIIGEMDEEDSTNTSRRGGTS